MPLREIENYFRNYDKKSYEVFSQQGAEPSQAGVAAFESRIGFSLPAEFQEFAVHPLGGLYMAVKKELWPRARAYEVGEFWSFLYGLMVYCLYPQAPDWLQMNVAWRRMSAVGDQQGLSCESNEKSRRGCSPAGRVGPRPKFDSCNRILR